ncbi:SDR family NAD(P)-dependent oxidoreductase [Novosphingobium aerophilum]|uniref:SDR family NAD(P)-dependent oxidoreductase n=1 Tax=Novosphingobium aerophilum TaxID=2839843 RepID=UPI003FD4410D
MSNGTYDTFGCYLRMAHHTLSFGQTSVAIVTGGESGIGRSAAIKLGKADLPVALTYFADQGRANAVVAEITDSGGRAVAVRTDVGDEQSVEALFDLAEERFGTVDLLVNSAGLNMTGVMLRDMELVQFDRLMRADLYGPFLTCRRMVRALDGANRGGRIVNISSIHERAPRAGGVDYDAAKGGLAQLIPRCVEADSRGGFPRS